MNLHTIERLVSLIIIYLDNCCYSRLTDEDSQLNTIAEAAKIQTIIDNRFFGGYMIVGSRAVTAEMGNNPNVVKRDKSEMLYRGTIVGEVRISAQVIARAQELESKGLRPMDARHLAAAEAARADYLLTTDLRFIKKCGKPNITTVRVINPLDF
jgi:predicted nucleic acid-binding protein